MENVTTVFGIVLLSFVLFGCLQSSPQSPAQTSQPTSTQISTQSSLCGKAVDKNMTLTEDLVCNSTAIIIGADGVLLDCAGHTIVYGNAEPGFGVLAGWSPRAGVTIKNCNIIQGSNGIAAIGWADGYDNSILNNTIITSSSTECGLVFEGEFYDNNISNNKINTNGSGSCGIYLKSNVYLNDFTDNIITTKGSKSSGIVINSSKINKVMRNHILTFGPASDGVSIQNASFGNSLTDNEVTINGSMSAGISILDSNSNLFTRNTIKSSDVGISLSSTESSNSNYTVADNLLFNNLINATTVVKVGDSVFENRWNAIKLSSLNVVSGPNIGGNFYANPAGGGSSDMCTDSNSDGFCDNNYTLGPNNIDSVPLSKIFG
jgi:hypothetical protein